jgi:hypothetical protein
MGLAGESLESVPDVRSHYIYRLGDPAWAVDIYICGNMLDAHAMVCLSAQGAHFCNTWHNACVIPYA